MSEKWNITLTKDAKKQYTKLGKSVLKVPSILSLIDILILDLTLQGPSLNQSGYYGLIQQGKDSYHHCHLKRGRPTYVAC